MANKFILLILSCMLCCVLAQNIIKVQSGQTVQLKCDINSTQTVTWYYGSGTDPTLLYNCYINQTSSRRPNDDEYEALYKGIQQVNRSKETSLLSLIPSKNEQTFRCKVGNTATFKTYRIIVVDPTKIGEYCNVSLPSISEGGNHQLILLCGFTFQGDLALRANLTIIEGFGQNNFQPSFESINRTLPLDHSFKNVYGANCVIIFPDIDVTQRCHFPNITQIKYRIANEDAIFECDEESEVDWHLFGLDGREEDITNRSWIRDGGRSLLILMISKEDVGKLVTFQTKGTDNQTVNGNIGFAVISEISGANNDPNSEDPTSAVPSSQSVFFVLTLLFLTLWLISCVVGGVILFCRRKNITTSTLTISPSSENGTPTNSNHPSNLRPIGNEDSGNHGTPLVRVTTEATNPDISNTNNSAHTPVLEREGDDENDDTLNRQSQDDSHLYFTLEKSPAAMSSFRRASAPRWAHDDTNSATLDQDRDSQWQGYATVGESNKNATCSYDLGEYAEVGEHLLPNGPPVESLRPPVLKKPLREQLKDEGISKLYGKVKK